MGLWLASKPVGSDANTESSFLDCHLLKFNRHLDPDQLRDILQGRDTAGADETGKEIGI